MNTKYISLFSLILGTPLIITSAIHPSIAMAQDAVFSSTITEVLPGEPVIADGSKEATYYFLVLNKDGTSVKGMSGKTQLGKIKGTLKDEGNGIYSSTFTPNSVGKSTMESLLITGETSARQRIKKSFIVELHPATDRTFTIEASPSEITLGQDDFVTVKINQTSGSSSKNLKLTSSAGSVENLVSLGNGQYSARYTPPSKPYPHIAVLTLSDLENPKNRTHYILKQKGKTNFAVNTNPNSNVIIRIEDRDFGPVQTDASGKASVPIVAPPGQSDAKLIVITNEERKEELLDLRIPKNVPRFNIFPTLNELPSDGFSTQPITFFVATAKGLQDTNAQIVCKAKYGQCGKVKALGNGYYQTTYTSPNGNSVKTEEIQAVLQGQSGDIISKSTFQLLPVIPSQINIKTAILELPKNAKDFSVTVQVKDGQGQGLDNRSLEFIANGAQIKGEPRSLGSGDYSVKLTPTTDGPIEITAAAKGAVSSNPPIGIAMKANHPTLVNDGISSSLLSFAVYDRFGQPIANQDIELSVNGGGSLPSVAKSNTSGLAQVTYTAGTESGIVTITAKSGNFNSKFFIILAPSEVLGTLPDLPRSQNQLHQRLQTRLFLSISSLRLEREGMKGVALPSNVDKIGAPSNIGLKAEPNKVTPGGKTTINISITDSNSRGISGEALSVMASAGTIGKVQDLGRGQYSVTTIAPTTGASSINIVVSTSDGALKKEMTIGVVGGTSPVENTAGNTSVTDKEPKTETPKKEKKAKEPREPRERKPQSDISTPWLRTSLGYTGGFYSFQQVPTSTTGLLYEKAITFNRSASGSSPAATVGFDARAYGTIPNIQYFGYDVHLQLDYYSVILEEFPEPVPDWLTSIDVNLTAGYPINLTAITLTPSARLGVLRDDLIVYRQDILDDGNISLSYEPVFVNAPNLGLGLDLDSAIGVFGHLTYDLGLRGSTIYRNKFDSQIGYDINEMLFLFGGARTSSRTVDIESSTGKAGETLDSNNSFIFGFGGALR